MKRLRKLSDSQSFADSVTEIFSNPRQLKLLLWLSLGIRLLFFISDGHNGDFDFFEHWADRIVHQGFTNIYSIQTDRFECDYPPLYLYVLAFFGHIFNFFGLPIHTHLFDTFLKLFNLLVEAVFLYSFYKKTSNKIFLFVMLISPVTLLNAYGWGQIDILYTILLFSTIFALSNQNLYSAALFLGLSLSLKTQTLLFVPIIGLLFLLSEKELTHKIKAFLLMLLVYLIPNIPFILFAPDAMDSINPHISAAGRYDFIAVNSFNLYWALWADFDLKMMLSFPPNDTLVLGLIARKHLAYLVFGMLYTFVLIQLYKHHTDPKKLYALLAFFCFSYFMFLPEMHERYLFPFFIFSAFLCSLDSKEFRYFMLISFVHALNLIWAWGEQKYIKEQWIFESTRIIALVSFIVWIYYAIATWKRLNQKDNQLEKVL